MQSMGKGREDLLIEAELFAEGLKVLPGVTVLRAAHIDHVSNHLGALNVSQKLEPETTILMCALNDTYGIPIIRAGTERNRTKG